jgi:hypothetical protein
MVAKTHQLLSHEDAKEKKRLSSYIKPYLVANSDLEGGNHLEKVDPAHATFEANKSSERITFAQIVNTIWHFCSVDYGAKCNPSVLWDIFVGSPKLIRNGQILASATTRFTLSSLMINASAIKDLFRKGRDFGLGSSSVMMVSQWGYQRILNGSAYDYH